MTIWGKSLRWSRAGWWWEGVSRTSREKKEGFGVQRTPPPTPSLHRAIPKLPTRWRAGAGRQAPPLILCPSPPVGWASTWAFPNPVSLNSVGERLYLGPSAAPTPQDCGLSL